MAETIDQERARLAKLHGRTVEEMDEKYGWQDGDVTVYRADGTVKSGTSSTLDDEPAPVPDDTGPRLFAEAAEDVPPSDEYLEAFPEEQP